MKTTKKISLILSVIEKSVNNYTIPLQEIANRMNKFQILVSLILSSRTKDQTTSLVMKRIIDKRLNSPSDFLKISQEELKKIIRPCGFFSLKAKYLKELSKILKDKPLPDTKEELLKLPGVGPKVANLFINYCLGGNEIAVDTHVFRIANRIFFKKKPSRNPEETEKRMKDIIPEGKRAYINTLFVKFGQNICLPINPLCNKCLLKRLCPSYKPF